MYRVRDISLQRKLGQKLFGVGTITVLSSDKTMPELVLKNVKHPETTKELLHESVEKMKIQRRVRIGELTSGGEHGCDSGCDGDDLDDDDLQN